jgi:hypothetical protein
MRDGVFFMSIEPDAGKLMGIGYDDFLRGSRLAAIAVQKIGGT